IVGGAGAGLTGELSRELVQNLGGDERAQLIASLIGGLPGGYLPGALARAGPAAARALESPAVQRFLSEELGGLRLGGEPFMPEGAMPGQLGFERELPYAARPGGVEPPGPAGPQVGQLGFETQLPYAAPPAAGGPGFRPGVQPGQVPMPGMPGPNLITRAGDLLHAVRIGSLAGGIPTLGHIAINPPVQAGLKLLGDVPMSVLTGHYEAVPMELYGALQGLRSWALTASQTLGAPGPLAESLGGGPGAQTTETLATGLVRLHPVLQDLARQ